MRGASQNLIRKCYLLGNLMFSATSLGLVVSMSLSWYFSPARGIRNLAIWTSVSLSPPWDIRAYPSRTSPRYIMYSHQRSESVSSMSCKEKKQLVKLRKYFSLCGGWACCTSGSQPENPGSGLILRIDLPLWLTMAKLPSSPRGNFLGRFPLEKKFWFEFLVINYYKMEHHFPEFPEEKTTLLGLPDLSKISYRK